MIDRFNDNLSHRDLYYFFGEGEKPDIILLLWGAFFTIIWLIAFNYLTKYFIRLIETKYEIAIPRFLLRLFITFVVFIIWFGIGFLIAVYYDIPLLLPWY